MLPLLPLCYLLCGIFSKSNPTNSQLSFVELKLLNSHSLAYSVGKALSACPLFRIQDFDMDFHNNSVVKVFQILPIATLIAALFQLQNTSSVLANTLLPSKRYVFNNCGMSRFKVILNLTHLFATPAEDTGTVP